MQGLVSRESWQQQHGDGMQRSQLVKAHHR